MDRHDEGGLMQRPALPSTPRERLIAALDFPSAGEAVDFARRVGDDVLWVKVGLELFCSAGPGVVLDLAGLGKRIFLDLKFHDIPNTVARAVAAAARLPVGLINLHASAGPKVMSAAQEVVAGRPDVGLLAVTRLTSDERGDPDYADVEQLAAQAFEAGFFGVVCPAPAAERLRRRFGDDLARVCPGIRPAGAGADDQVHIATPGGAVAAGAHWIVVGRPITGAADPAEAARAIAASIGQRV
jgi:orotidine-5'-phosphate decarboxylase